MNGFIIVASLNKAYYETAHFLIVSILDHMPEANICLFAHREWTEGDKRCDDLLYVKDCPRHVRSKLWALSRSPFDTTVYLDCDTWVQHEDVSKMFDLKGNDMMFTNIRPYAGKIAKFVGGEMILHGGVFAYDTKRCKKFLEDWWEYYWKQRRDEWWPEGCHPKKKLVSWDQFTLWWLLENEYKDQIKVGIYEDDARFNFVYIYKEDECEGEIVVWHYTIPHSYRDSSEKLIPTSELI